MIGELYLFVVEERNARSWCRSAICRTETENEESLNHICFFVSMGSTEAAGCMIQPP